MGNWNDLKKSVAQVIRENGNQEITGQILQNALNTIISNVGQHATFVDIATPSTNPGTPDGNVFYIASQAGIYANFGGVSLDGQEVCVLQYNGTAWTAKSTGAATKTAITNTVNLTDLDFGMNMIGKIITAGNSCRFVVIRNRKNVGTLECFSDDSNHVVTQVFTTHCLLPFSNNSHTDDKIYTYWRSYHLSGGTSQIPSGTWGEWKLVYSSDNDDRLNEVEASSENLSKNVGIDEYEVFSNAKSYSAGTTVNYNGLLYTFTTDHEAGAWDEGQVEPTSLKKEVERASNLLAELNPIYKQKQDNEKRFGQIEGSITDLKEMMKAQQDMMQKFIAEFKS